MKIRPSKISVFSYFTLLYLTNRCCIQGDPKKHEYRTINARLEHLHTSKLYRHAFVARKFCVVVAQGFYEWMPIKGTESPRKGVRKQPYFVFRQQDPKLGPDAAADDEAWTSGVWSEEEGWNGPKILMMAGLYDIWHSPEVSHEKVILLTCPLFS